MRTVIIRTQIADIAIKSLCKGDTKYAITENSIKTKEATNNGLFLKMLIMLTSL